MYFLNYNEWDYRVIDVKLLVCSIFLLLLTRAFLKWKICASRYSIPPEAPYGPISTVLASKSKRLHLLVLDSSRKVGSIFRLNLLTTKVLVVNDANVCREILCHGPQEKTNITKVLRIFHGQRNDIFSSNGSHWYHARKGIAPAFSSRHIHRMERVVIEHTKNLISNKLDQIMEEGLAFDVGDEMISLTLGIICETAFEYHIDQEERCMFRTELQVLVDELSKQRIPFRWMFGSLNPAIRRARAGTGKLVAFGLKVIDSYHQLESPIKGTVIDCITRNKAYKNDMERVADVLLLLFAGHDTTAYSIAWTLIELAKNPIDQAVLHEELNSVTFNERKHVNMLKNVIQESLRFHPVVGLGIFRYTQKTIIMKQKSSELEFKIPKGATVMIPSASRHRDVEYYEEPDVFKPSRWEDPSEKAVSAFMPYGVGKRNCIGQSLANAELYSVMACLCAEYHFSIEDEGTAEMMITLKPVGFRLKMSKH